MSALVAIGFSQEIADSICERIANGESLRSICRCDDMPSAGTVCRWLSEPDRDDLREQYARAREAQADAFADELTDIADDGTNDWMEKFDKDGKSLGWELNGEHVQRSRLRVDTRKWIASKLKPKVYGDKLDITERRLNVHVLADMSSEERRAMLAGIVQRALGGPEGEGGEE